MIQEGRARRGVSVGSEGEGARVRRRRGRRRSGVGVGGGGGGGVGVGGGGDKIRILEESKREILVVVIIVRLIGRIVELVGRGMTNLGVERIGGRGRRRRLDGHGEGSKSGQTADLNAGHGESLKKLFS